MYDVELTPAFLRRANRFFRNRPELRHRFADLIADLRRDPFQAKLRLHPLSGAMRGPHAVRLTYDVRVVLTFVIDERSITLVDIGGHDEVYR